MKRLFHRINLHPLLMNMFAVMVSIITSCYVSSSDIDKRLTEAESLILSSHDSALLLIEAIGNRGFSHMDDSRRYKGLRNCLTE